MCMLSKSGKVVVKRVRSNQIYVYKSDETTQKRHSTHVSFFQLWHEGLAHVHNENILNMAQNGSFWRIIISPKTGIGTCKGCVARKAHQGPIPKKRSCPQAKDLLHLVYYSVCDPQKISSLGSSR